VSTLDERAEAFVQMLAGFCLTALGRLAEAAQLIQAGLKYPIAQEDWVNASIGASNLCELYTTIGDLPLALTYARQGIELADRSGVIFQKIHRRARLADALHQSGNLLEAEAAFREAEHMQREDDSRMPFLYSLSGYQFCSLLLSQAKYKEVQSRAAQTLEWAKQYQMGPLTTALDYLSLGCAYMLQARYEPTGDLTHAAHYLNQAVDGLRQAGQLDDLPRGLLARAELRRLKSEFDRARQDVHEAMSITTRGGMRLHQTDCHLGYARLHLAEGDKERARDHLRTAKNMIKSTGYHRRDIEVQEIEQQLGERVDG
jgi:tetratricopeptide (TPR) repeat protein